MAHALDLVGDRWALLVVRELMHGPKRYTDLVDHLPGIGTNILAARLRDLEAGGVVAKRTLPPPAASQVYELTEYGRGAEAGACASSRSGARARSGRRRTRTSSSRAGWRTRSTSCSRPWRPTGRFEFRVGDEVASLVDGEAVRGPGRRPRRGRRGRAGGDLPPVRRAAGRTRCRSQGDRELLQRLVEASPQPLAEPSGVTLRPSTSGRW